MPDVTYRLGTSDDVPGILETLRLSLGETPTLKRTPELWNWKHAKNPFGKSIVFVAEGRGVIAGVRALMRWEMQTPQGEALKCLRPVDTATHPRFRRLGIFQELTTAALQVARSEGSHLIFNTPNEKSAPGYLKMGWKRVGSIGVLARLRLGPVPPTLASSIPSIDNLAPKMVSFKELSAIPTKNRAPRGLRTNRSADYLAWRFRGHPTASYGYLADQDGSVIVGRASRRSQRSELVISDILGQPRTALVRRAVRSSRARYVAGWFSRGTPERKAAIGAGMLPVPMIRPLQLVALPLTDLEVDTFNLASWDIATSDLELL